MAQKHRNRTELIETLTYEELKPLDMGQLSALANKLGLGRSHYDGKGTVGTRNVIWRYVLSQR